MKLDYRQSTRDEIVKKIKEMNGLQLWAKILWDMKSEIFFSLSKPSYFVINFEKLKQQVEALVESYIQKVNSVFDMAWETDQIYSDKGNTLNESGKELLSKLIVLTDIATPEGLPTILSNDAFLTQLPEGDSVLEVDTVISAEVPSISDAELIEKAPTLDANGFHECLSNAQNAVLQMGTGTAILIALFQHKEILKDELLYDISSAAIMKYVRELILEGKEGYTTVSEIAAKLGLSEKDTIYLLKNDRLPMPGFDPDKPFSANSGAPLLEEAKIKGLLAEILRDNLDNAINDEGMFAELCKAAGMNEDIIEAVVSGNYSGYTYALYQSEIAATLADLCSQKSLKIYPSRVKKIIGALKGAYSLENTGDKGAELKKILENGKLSDKEVRDFLKKYCGFSSVSSQDIRTFRDATLFMKKTSAVSGKLSDAQKVIDYATKWMADYEAELEILDQMIAVGGGSAEYQMALQRLRDTYSSKFEMIMDDAVNLAADKGIDAAIDLFKPLSLAETAISLAGTVTGASGYADAAQKTLALQLLSSDAVDSYNSALGALQAGDTSQASLQNVRTAFSFAKQTLSDYYSAQAEYYKGFLDQGKDPQMSTYLEHEAFRIKNLELGEPFDPMSFKEFVAQFG